uniref:Uncharacterized protein n=1 Tax=Dulem virus 34 TaxID=3145752 RepID=A0AAU8B631_9CAUD
MSSAINHQRRAHRSEKAHYTCVHQMKQFSPVLPRMGPIPLGLFGGGAGKHRLGRIKRKRDKAEK